VEPIFKKSTIEQFIIEETLMIPIILREEDPLMKFLQEIADPIDANPVMLDSCALKTDLKERAEPREKKSHTVISLPILTIDCLKLNALPRQANEKIDIEFDN
jgi:hypothetical protein